MGRECPEASDGHIWRRKHRDVICLIHGRPAGRALCGLVTKFPVQHGTREIERGTVRPIEMKRRASLPYHKMLKPMTPLFEVSTKVVHDGNVISEGLRPREMGKPATLLAFREVNPSTCRGHGGHRFGGASGVGEIVTVGWSGGGRMLGKPGLSRPA